MKIGLLGDIHGNHLALQQVIAAATKAGVEKLLITGDLVGYYFEPKRVLELLNPWDKHVVRGNHEDMLVAAMSDVAVLDRVDRRYGTGLRVAIEQLDEVSLGELASLPASLELLIDGCKILLCHGAPWDNDAYVYPDAMPPVLERCAVPEFDLVVLGHTHYPMLHQIGRTQLVNPGSVGQPRNRVPGAHWAIFDTLGRDVEFCTEPYDPSALVRECELRHPELPYLSEVLLRK